jgi:hypothetical protein
MPEPASWRRRHITMVRALVLVVLLVLTGCGSGDRKPTGEQAAPSPTGTPTVLAGQPPVSSTFRITVPGLPSPLLVTEQKHPRGGFQLRVFAPEKGTWTELEVDGHPLVPFIALDVKEHPLSIDCEDGGVVVTEAVPHEPHGVVFAWDVRRTSYAVDGAEVTAGTADEVADNVLPRQLEAKYPDLVRHTMFESCRAAG